MRSAASPARPISWRVFTEMATNSAGQPLPGKVCHRAFAEGYSVGQGRHSAIPRPMIQSISSGDRNFMSSVNSVTACR